LTAQEAQKLRSKDHQEFMRHLSAWFARWCEQESLKLPDIDRKVAGLHIGSAYRVALGQVGLMEGRCGAEWWS